jgi:RHS repeat-associated protein
VGVAHATLINGATYSTGKVGSALTVSTTSNQYASIPNNAFPWGTNTYTVNFWFKYNTAPTNGIFLNQQRASKGLILYYAGGALTFVSFTSPSLNLSWAGDTNWHMLTARSNASGHSFFLDGTLGASDSAPGNILVTGSDPMVIGANQADGAFIPGFYFDGEIDELSVTPTSLSNADIQGMYNGGVGSTYLQATTTSTYLTPDYTGTYIDTSYTPLPTITYGALPAVSYPYATSSVASSTINRLTVATTTSYTVYTPLSNYVQDSRGTKTTYLTLNGTLVGAYTYQTGQEASTGKLSYILTNYLGTPTVTTDDKGDITELGITDVFGNYKYRDTRKDAALHTKTFTGHEWDDTTGLVYAHARYLDTKAHTFLSVDPMLYSLPSSYLTDPQQMNSYAYARNNPVTMTDPTGRYSLLGTLLNIGRSAVNSVVNYVNSYIINGKQTANSNTQVFTAAANSVVNKIISYANNPVQTAKTDYSSVVNSASTYATAVKANASQIWNAQTVAQGDAAMNGPAGSLVKVGVTVGVGKVVETLGSLSRVSGATKYWTGTNMSTESSMSYHLSKHGAGLSIDEYTQQAVDFYGKYKLSPEEFIVKPVDLKTTPATQGIKIKNPVTGEVGIYDPSGKIVTFIPAN